MRAEQLAANGDPVGAAVWRRITDAIKQFTNATPSGPLHIARSGSIQAGMGKETAETAAFWDRE